MKTFVLIVGFFSGVVLVFAIGWLIAHITKFDQYFKNN